MKSIKAILSFAFLLGFFMAATAGIAQQMDYSPIAGGVAGLGVLALSAYVSTGSMGGYYTSGVQKEIWTNHIIANLFKNNEFMTYAFNADEYVLQGKVVHIPQANAPSAVVKNRSSFPATVTRRSDSDVTYPLDEYTSDPRAIANADTVELSYDKRQSVTEEDQMALRETVAENMLINWAPSVAGSIYRTTGGSVAATTPSATGTRKMITTADFRAIMTMMNKANIPLEDRYCILSADMYDQLISQLSETQYKDVSSYLDANNGILGKLYSFKILSRSSVLVFDNSGTPVVKAYGAAGAATDNDTALFWQKNSIERALGEVLMFEQANSPTHYADVYSFLLRMGGRIRRNDQKGVVACVQTLLT